MRDEAVSIQDGGLVAAESSNGELYLLPTSSNDPSASATPISKPTSSRGWLSGVRRPRTSPGPKASAFKRSLVAEDDLRRDSALATLTSTSSTDQTVTNNAPSSPTSLTEPTFLRKTPSLPAIVVQHESVARANSRIEQSLGEEEQRAEHKSTFEAIDTIIPTGGFDDLTSPSQVSFSKRGSMLLGGKRANKMNLQLGLVEEGEPTSPTAPLPEDKGEAIEKKAEENNGEQSHEEGGDQLQVREKQEQQPTQTPEQNDATQSSTPSNTYLSPRTPSRMSSRARASNRILSADEMMLSRKVRLMYRHGNEGAAEWNDLEEEEEASGYQSVTDSSVSGAHMNGSTLTVDRSRGDASSLRSYKRTSIIAKEAKETAGGLEDWTNVEGGEVDRYGFIVPRKVSSQGSSNGVDDGPEEPRIQRVSTVLQLVSEEPRKRGLGRTLSKARSARSLRPSTAAPRRRGSQESSRPQASIFSGQTTRTNRTASQRPLRQATNRLPHNRDRRLMDEASDMLKLPPGLAELAEQEEGGKAAQAMKMKEIEREEKWRKMAHVVQCNDAKGGGMMFEFDVRDPKLISRTWKGIPDRWRSTAWYAFLAASAKAEKHSPTDEELIESFYELQEEGSADDMQIDVDVPRTINRHIMFRRRYRGGQRLLFRVLHAMALYLPDTGYVQGMAALAATLLCYYEEDKAFVMLVRLWMLRGLEKLYEAGFTGLMDALEDFEKNWLRGGDVAKKLEELCITSTAYGTRWYLTLFNYSLPFPAQLRVWDVFMLLGDASNSKSSTSQFSGDLDVLHATSAALIDATREILLDSDFENTMKVLTSWIPIKDEDLLMRVAKAEYKMRKKRANA